MVAGSGVRGIWMGILGVLAAIFLFLCEGIKEHLLVEDSVGISMAWN